MEKEEIRKKINVILYDILEEETPDYIPEDQELMDRGHDSLDMIQFVVELEKEFKVTIPDQEVENLKTIDDFVNFIGKIG